MWLVRSWVLVVAAAVGAARAAYNVGVGIADMTGPPVEIRFMGYANLEQTGRGIHLRQFSRAFIFEQDGERFVYVMTDLQSVGIALRRAVIGNLQSRYGELYTERNVILGATHTHSTPGGYLVDFLYDVSILGFSQETFDAYTVGITLSIVRAHEAIVPARIYFGQIEVEGVNINRSPFSYLQNPEIERARYSGDTDTTLSQLRVERAADARLLGALHWFAVHTVSMNMSNQLVSSDNLGYAAVLLEKRLNPPGTRVGQGAVVVAFGNSNEGDMSPNTAGPRCEFSRDVCDGQFLLCPGSPQEQCYASGPGEDMFHSTRLIAETIADKAQELLNSGGEEVEGPVAVAHQFVDIPDQVVPKYDPVTRTFNESDSVGGCVAGMGYSFAAGTTDGASALNITQGTTTGNPLLDQVRDLLGEPTEQDVECHAPKPILLATGRSFFPVPWHPRVVSAAVLRLGRVLVLGLPGEFTTMAGRRLRDVVSAVAAEYAEPARVLLGGLTNDYTHYITTFEEYQVQRYEGASTMFGPHTLDIYLNKFAELARALYEGTEVPPGPQPGDYLDSTITLITPVVLDTAPLGRNFGECVVQPNAIYWRPGQVVTATFISGNPRNDVRQGRSFLAVEQLQEDGSWTVIATDADWETTFEWERLSLLTGTSQVHITWTISEDIRPGTYRIRHYGDYKPLVGDIRGYEGVSSTFVYSLPKCTPRALRQREIKKNKQYHLSEIIRRQKQKIRARVM